MNSEAHVDKALAVLSSLLPAEGSKAGQGRSLRPKLLDLTNACADMCREAETAVQLNMKNEAFVVQLRNDLAESRATELALRRECVEAARVSSTKYAVHSNKMLVRSGQSSESDIQDKLLMENECLLSENKQLRNTLMVLQEQVSACDLALHCMEKEMAGRIQQVQLLLRELELSSGRPSSMNSEVWEQLEEELAVQRHKSIVDIMRRNSLATEGGMPPCPHTEVGRSRPKASLMRRVLIVRDSRMATLGISVAGGKEFGTPLFVSRIAPGSPAEHCSGLYVGDSILTVHGVDVRNATHQEFVDLIHECPEEVDFVVDYQSHHCDRHHDQMDGAAKGAHTPSTPRRNSQEGREMPPVSPLPNPTALGSFSSASVQLSKNAPTPDGAIAERADEAEFCTVGSEPVNELFSSY